MTTRNKSLLVFVLVALLVGGWLSCRYGSSFPVFSEKEIPVVTSLGTIASGGSLYQSLLKEGLPSTEVYKIIQAMKPLVDLTGLKPGDRYEVVRSTSGSFVKMRYWLDAFRYVDVSTTLTQELLASPGALPLEEAVKAVQGTITSSLWESLSAQGLTPDLIMRLADIFAWEIDFLTEPRDGDTYRIVWRRKTHKDLALEGEILAAYYNGKISGEHTGILFQGDYYDEKGQSLRRQFLKAPLNYRRISSHFSRRRYHPILRIWRPHHGIDYAAARGTPVVSIGDGVVSFRGWHGGTGKMIKVRHNGTYSSIYGHLSRYTRGIAPGVRVKQNQVIGYVGSTGLSTGPHLHFGLERNGILVNFESLRLPSVGNVARNKRSEFEVVASAALAQLTQIP